MSEVTQNPFLLYGQRIEGDALEVAKASITDSLLSEGVDCVCIHYDGVGDNGQIEEFWILHPEDETRHEQLRDADGSVRSRHDLVRALEAFAWMVLGGHIYGFEVDEGGTGNIVINAKNREELDWISVMHISRELNYFEV